MYEFLQSRLSPFKHQSFRRFFVVQAVSQIGTWSHDLARAWIVLELLGTAGALGSLMLASAIPSLLLILHGGVLVDRVDVRKLMIFTKGILAVSALALAYMVEFHEIKLWHLLIFGAIEGCVNSFDSPAYQALAVRLVPRKDFQQALAFNSMNFHTGRTFGPLVAGLLMAWHGPSAVFVFDAFSYVGVIGILSVLSLESARRDLGSIPKNRWVALKQGFNYMADTPKIRYILSQLLLTICLIFPLLIVVFRTYLKEKFQLDAESFGYIFAFPALGAMLGALTFTLAKPDSPIRVLRFSIPGLLGFLGLLTLVPTATMASLTMAAAGFFSYMSFASLTVSTHLEVEEEYRGRVGSIIGMSFLSIGPLMGFPVGLYADWVGYETSIYSLGAIFGLCSALLAIKHRRQMIAQRDRALRYGN